VLPSSSPTEDPSTVPTAGPSKPPTTPTVFHSEVSHFE